MINFQLLFEVVWTDGRMDGRTEYIWPSCCLAQICHCTLETMVPFECDWVQWPQQGLCVFHMCTRVCCLNRKAVIQLWTLGYSDSGLFIYFLAVPCNEELLDHHEGSGRLWLLQRTIVYRSLVWLNIFLFSEAHIGPNICRLFGQQSRPAGLKGLGVEVGACCSLTDVHLILHRIAVSAESMQLQFIVRCGLRPTELLRLRDGWYGNPV